MKNVIRKKQDLEILPHPLKAVFRQARITHLQLSKPLSTSISTIGHWLNMGRPIPPQAEATLYNIAYDLGLIDPSEKIE